MNFLEDLPKPFFALAPMDDVTDTVFRRIVADIAVPDIYFTEFVNVDGLQSPGRPRLLHKLRLSNNEGPVIAQLWGLNPDNYYKTVKEIINGTLTAEANAMQGKDEKRSEVYRQDSERASESLTPQSIASIGRAAAGGLATQANAFRGKYMGYQGVDLNMGCPVKTVVKNGACSALINNRKLAGEIIDAVQEAVGDHFPFSIKTRLGFNNTDLSWIDFLLSKKLNMLTIHGRISKQMSKGFADWDLIGEAKKMRDSLSPHTLIVGNGDVKNRHHGLELAQKYQLDGIMIGRGIFDDPFAFAEKSLWPKYTKQQKIDLYRKHVELFAATWHYNERRIETLNKFCKVYINGFDGAKELREKLMNAKCAEELQAMLKL